MTPTPAGLPAGTTTELSKTRSNDMTTATTDSASSADQNTRLYEGMFVLSQGVAADLTSAIEHIDELFNRAGATVVAMRKWDERRLAYEIDKQKRAVFILTYFTAPNDGVASLERDCNLSEKIMRMLVTRADHMTIEEGAAADDREGLAAEARMRADRASSAEEEKRTGVRIGKPEEQIAAEKAAAEAAAAKKAEAEQAPDDAPTEGESDAEPAAEG
jgi:small subunit ribosomal protein S6